MDDLTRRAFTAYFRTGGLEPPQPGSATTAHAGKQYVVLRNAGGVLAIYRVRNDGMLKRLKRWPPALEVT